MRLLLFVLVAFAVSCSTNENSNEDRKLPASPIRSNTTFTYQEGIAWWDSLAHASAFVSMEEYGITDAGYPLHLMTWSAAEASPFQERKAGKCIILINNAIHPGEPDGVDASMNLYRKLCLKPELMTNPDVVLVCIPFYNIGGALNRNSHSRANQNGPQEYGFRGNAQNLDLNRDFAKMDSRNAASFAQLVQQLDPDIYIETHVSNGADYQYTMSYLPTQTDKLGYGMGNYMLDSMIPSLENAMTLASFPMTPYVNIHGAPLTDRIEAFYDSPRYSTGLTSLHQIFGFITESHMFKPYDDRVKATQSFLEALIGFASNKASEIQLQRAEARKLVSQTDSFPLDYVLDTSRHTTLAFQGYELVYDKSPVTGQASYHYDRSKPAILSLAYYRHMKGIELRSKPKAYVLPAGFVDVKERLDWNGISYRVLPDTTMLVVSYRISHLETIKSPYEKHYYHYNTKFERDTMEWTFNAGDLYIETNTSKDRFLVEMLEPDGPDSYFNWNFYDAILQQKEWFSPYIFQDEAAQLLAQDSALRTSFEQQDHLHNNPSPFAALYWIYQQTEHYEKEHMRLPVFRVE